MTQDDLFWREEADRYFERNRQTTEIEDICFHDIDEILRILSSHSADINDVLEIGSSSGRKLEKLCRGFEARGSGVDPSALAIEQGKSRLQETDQQIEFFRALSKNLPFSDHKFDLVLLGFFLYVEDRASLPTTLIEADRVLKAGGCLIIRDFAPELPHDRIYKHDNRLLSFKNNYSRFFLSLGHYVSVAYIPFDRNGAVGFELDEDYREQLVILQKKVVPYPLVGDA